MQTESTSCKMSDSTNDIADKLLWSRPERKNQRGKILLIGGNSQEFVDMQVAYAAANEVGIQQASIVLPDKLKRMLGGMPNVEFVPSTPSGSFAKDGLQILSSLSQASDVTVLCGELSNNSETSVVIEQLSQADVSPLVLIGDSIMHAVGAIAERNEPTVIIGAKSAFQELISYFDLPSTITSQSNPSHIRNTLTDLAIASKSMLVLHHSGTIFIANDQNSTQIKSDSMNHPKVAVFAAELLAEFPKQQFEAVVAGIKLIKE